MSLADVTPFASPSPTSGAAQAVVIDPTALALLSIFGGVIVTALVGLLGAWIQSRREHSRWLRERRFDAITKAFAITKGFDLNRSKVMKIVEREGKDENDPRVRALLDQADELYTTVAEGLAPIAILGPAEVSNAYMDMQAAYEAEDDEALGEAEVAFRDAARRALKVKD